MMGRVMSRLFPPKRIREVRLYGKPGCHLCEDARAMLDRLTVRYPMNIVEVDIRQDPALFREYDILIPVIEIDGKEKLQAPVTERAMRRALR
jgi:glutaredoxin